mgnify:FL=1
MTAKQYLKQTRYLDERINTKITQVSSLHDLAAKATSTLSDMPGSPTRNTHRMEDIIIKILMLENEINADIDHLIDLKDEILSVIKAVDDEECRLLLEKRYLNFEQWEDIAAEMCTGVKNIYRLHDKALKMLILPEKCQ